MPPVQQVPGTVTGTSSPLVLSLPANATPGNVLVLHVAVGYDPSDGVSFPSVTGVGTWTRQTNSGGVHGSPRAYSSWQFAADTLTAATDVTIDFGGFTVDIAAHLSEWPDVTNVITGSGGNVDWAGAIGTSISGPSITPDAGDLVVGVVGTVDPASVTPSETPSGWTALTPAVGAVGIWPFYRDGTAVSHEIDGSAPTSRFWGGLIAAYSQTLPPPPPISGSATMDRSRGMTVVSTTTIPATTVSADVIFGRDRNMTAVASLEIPVADPPAGLPPRHVTRVSEFYDPPTQLNPFGRPVGWQPTMTLVENIGKVRILAGGVTPSGALGDSAPWTDITHFRGAETIVEEYSSTDPFGDATATITLPQISPLDTPGVGDLDWLHPRNDIKIEIRLHFEDGFTFTTQFGEVRVDFVRLFSGLCPARSTSTSSRPAAKTLHCIGALYQLDYYVKPPFIDITPQLLPHQIGHAIVDRAIGYGYWGGYPIDEIGDTTTTMTAARGSWSKLLTDYISSILQVGTLEDGSQVTVMQAFYGQPIICRRGDHKNVWTVRSFTPAITEDIDTDAADDDNAWYASWIDKDGGRASNLKMPGVDPTDAPAYPLSTSPPVFFDPGDGTGGFQPFSDMMRDSGYDEMVSQDTYLAADEDDVRDFQQRAGISVDGVVGSQTWQALFSSGALHGHYDGFYLPVAVDPAVVPYKYSGDGDIIGDNPAFNPAKIRREGYRDYGQPWTKRRVRRDGQWRIARAANPGRLGTITLKGDPQEGWRGLIRAGDEIVDQGFEGDDPVFHIAAVTVSKPHAKDCTVSLTVDTKHRDLLSLAERLDARRAARLPKVARKPNPNSRVVVDSRITFEKDIGAGKIGPISQTGGLGQVYVMPAAERGRFVGAFAHTEADPTIFCIALFNQHVTDTQIRVGILQGHDPLSYMTVGSSEQSPWDHYYKPLIDAGWIDTFGGPDQPGGYSPYPAVDHNGNPSPVTGEMISDGTVEYSSNAHGRLFVWVFTRDTTLIRIKLLPAAEDLST